MIHSIAKQNTGRFRYIKKEKKKPLTLIKVLEVKVRIKVYSHSSGYTEYCKYRQYSSIQHSPLLSHRLSCHNHNHYHHSSSPPPPSSSPSSASPAPVPSGCQVPGSAENKEQDDHLPPRNVGSVHISLLLT